MKFYSECTNHLYDTVDECTAAEKAYLEERDRRENAKALAEAELETLYDTFNKSNDDVKKAQANLGMATKTLQSAISNFSKKYGYIPEKYRAFNLLTWLMPH